MLLCDPFAVEPGHFHLVTADEQTAGRGQRGTTWESTKGLNLTFNIGWRPVAGNWPAANEQFLVSEITALAVLHAIEDTLSEATCSSHNGGGWEGAIKWPNDIYIIRTAEDTSSLPIGEGGGRGLKICGMLLEHSLSGRNIEASIAGIGINVNQTSFATLEGREEGRSAPISLRQIVGHEVSREAVLESFISHFMDGVTLLQEGRYDEVESAFTALLYRRSGWYRYRDAEGEFMGEFAGIARNGTLSLRKTDGTLHEYAFKEVTFVI